MLFDCLYTDQESLNDFINAALSMLLFVLQSLPNTYLEHQILLQIKFNLFTDKVLLVKELLNLGSSSLPPKECWVSQIRHCFTVRRMSCKRQHRDITVTQLATIVETHKVYRK